MTSAPRISFHSRAALAPAAYQAIVSLCTRAYAESFAEVLAPFTNATHVLAYEGERLVSHALWIPRLLTADGVPLRSAYVEAVATEPRFQGRGLASAVMRALAGAIAADDAIDIGALSPSDPRFYERLGWESWRGPLAIATDAGVVPTPDEGVMILRLPHTGDLDLDGTLIAPWREGEVW